MKIPPLLVAIAMLIILLLPKTAQSQQALADSLNKVVAAAEGGSDHRAALAQYCGSHQDDGSRSTAVGTAAKGSLLHGKLIPFQGPNYRYYDTLSYLDDRAFVHHGVKKAVLAAYEEMDSLFPRRLFTIMECSKKDGGKIWPHRTHQNGVSIDFMVPMTQGGNPYYGLDTMGFSHYLLDFADDGSAPGLPDVKIDFDIVAAHLLSLQRCALKNGLAVSKILLKKELLDELFASRYGPQLKASKLYFPQGLEPLINQLHDNHYHIDFVLR